MDSVGGEFADASRRIAYHHESSRIAFGQDAAKYSRDEKGKNRGVNLHLLVRQGSEPSSKNNKNLGKALLFLLSEESFRHYSGKFAEISLETITVCAMKIAQS